MGSARLVTNLVAGTYSVTMTQIATGCTGTRTNVLSEAPPIVVTENMTQHIDVNCTSASTGQASVSASGGTGGRVYVWNNGTIGNKITNVAAGTYTVTATDVTSCSGTATVTITEPATVVDVTNVQITGSGPYMATITASGGTGPLSYSKNGTNFSNTTGIFPALAAGSYTFYARDANLCVDAYPVTISALGAEVRGKTEAFAMQMLLSPNPATDVLNVRLLDMGVQGEMLVQDALGRIVLRKKVDMKQGESMLINLERFQSGSYCLQLRGNNGEMATKCFVVVR